MRKLWYCLAMILLLVMASQLTFHIATAESASNYNSILYPDLPQDLWVHVTQTIQGTSTLTQGLEGCPAGSYNWDYQANLRQGPELGNSWIQQVIEVSQSGSSCYTIEYWPTYGGNSLYYYSIGIGPSNIFYDAFTSSDISFQMSYTGGSTYTVTGFYISACCVNGNTVTWVIYPSQLENSLSVLLNSPVQFDTSSLEDFNIVATGSIPPNYGVATFTSGAGQINYCSYNNAGNVEAQTGETSNMVYSALTQNVCGSGNLNWFYQSFNPGTSPTPSVTVQSVDQNNNVITGYYTVLYNYDGTAIDSGFTPVTFSGLTLGYPYSVGPENYGSCTFNHWQDTGSTTRDRSFVATSTQTFSAVYDCT